jgi:Arc/MetJ family transcription regulator
MLTHIRTTIDIPDALLARARERAHAEGRTLRSVMTEALRNALDEPPAGRAKEFELPAYGGSGTADMLTDILGHRAICLVQQSYAC